MYTKNVDKMSLTEIKVYVAELEAKVNVYESVISNSNFRAILGERPTTTRRTPNNTEEFPKRNTRNPKGAKPKTFKTVDTGVESEE